MPITEFQHAVLAHLKQHRNPNSYIAGAVAINRDPSSARYSNDVDFFHETDEAVQNSANADIAVLQEQQFTVEIVIRQPSFIRAVISRGGHVLKLEWVRDTAFRFFPVLEDELLGYRLHDIDLAVNKCLALANRTEVRDIIDVAAVVGNCILLAGLIALPFGLDLGVSPLPMAVDTVITCIGFSLFAAKISQARQMVQLRRSAGVSWGREIGFLLKDITGLWYAVTVGGPLFFVGLTHSLSIASSLAIIAAKLNVERKSLP